jgi:hypothetical protein
VNAAGARRLQLFGSGRRLGAAIIPHRPPLAFLADSGGRLRVSLTARSQWHSRRRRYWKTMQVLLASAVAVSGSFNGECDAKC